MATTSNDIPLAADLISEQDFAQTFGKSLRTVRRWHLERRGPRRTRIGKSIFYRRESVEAWLRQLEEPSSCDV